MSNTNAKYTGFEEIFTRVASLYKNKNLNPSEVLEWCIQCETEWINDFASLVPYLKVRLDVRDKMARIPPYKVRILDVYENPDDERSHVNYYDSGAYIVLNSNYKKDYIYVNFMGIAVDPETGIPYIKKGHEEACVRHVLVCLHEEDYMNGKIDQNRWNYLVEERDHQVRAAKADYSSLDRRDLMLITATKLNMLPYLKFNTLHHKRPH